VIYALNETGARIRPEKTGQRASCPCCNTEVMSKCGELMVWHWAHVSSDCDRWTEPESAWHLWWKLFLEREYGAHTEVTIQRDGVLHRADAVLPDGAVVEIQHSALSADAVGQRERFYGRIIWIIDVAGPWQRGRLKQISLRRDAGGDLFGWKRPRGGFASAGGLLILDGGVFGAGPYRDMIRVDEQLCGLQRFAGFLGGQWFHFDKIAPRVAHAG
jgi:hypothetical protein